MKTSFKILIYNDCAIKDENPRNYSPVKLMAGWQQTGNGPAYPHII